MVDLLYRVISLLFFDIINDFCLISEGINLPLSISSSFVSELFFGEVFETVVILSAILFRIKSPVASAVF